VKLSTTLSRVLATSLLIGFAGTMQPGKSQTDELCRNRFRVVDNPVISNLVIRSGPKNSDTAVGMLTNGQEVIFVVSDRSGDWSNITAQGGASGWVRATILRDMEGLPRKFNGILRVKTLDGDPVRLRARAGLRFEVIDSIKSNTQVQYVSREAEWTQVRTRLGQQGYIASEFLICD